MDTVYNDDKLSFLQTFKFVRAGILPALYRNENSASMKEGIDITGIHSWHRIDRYVHVFTN